MLRNNYWWVVIWHNNNKGVLYCKKIRHLPTNYSIGYTNGYNHTIIYIVDIYDLFFEKRSIRKRTLTLLIDKLESINKRL
jgi:hypothetical protein